MKKFKFLFISVIILVVGVGTFSSLISLELGEYEKKQVYAAEQLNFEERLFNAWEWIPYTNVGDGKVKTWQELHTSAMANYYSAILYGAILMLFVFVFVAANFRFYRDTDLRYQAMGLAYIFAAFSFLYLGLTAPLIEIMAYSKDLSIDIPVSDYTGADLFGFDMTAFDMQRTVDGRTYYIYEIKSILGLISILFLGGNFLIAFALALFSVVFPVAKLLFSINILLRPERKSSLKKYRMIRNLGKWSMIDVFVASIFLALFSYASMNVGVDKGAETLPGTYFFLLFICLSISSGQFLKKAMKKAQPVADWVLE